LKFSKQSYEILETSILKQTKIAICNSSISNN